MVVKDVIAIVIVLGFFALAAAYVGWCDRIATGGAPETSRSGRLEPEASVDRTVVEAGAHPGVQS